MAMISKASAAAGGDAVVIGASLAGMLAARGLLTRPPAAGQARPVPGGSALSDSL